MAKPKGRENAPREFWVCNAGMAYGSLEDAAAFDIKPSELFHVIEYSAYEAVLSGQRKGCPKCGYNECVRGRKACDTEIEALRKERDEAMHRSEENFMRLHHAEKLNIELQAQNEMLVSVLMDTMDSLPNPGRTRGEVSKALEEYRKRKEGK